MPRMLREDFPGARHHVMNRGARHRAIFESPDDALLFLRLLAELPDRFGVVVHAYALMPNHYHLMIGSPQGNLSVAMQHLGARFTQAINARHEGWDGPIFRGRFRSRVAPRDAYWKHLLAYVHLNPVRARLAVDEDAALWTSHAAYAERGKRPDWLTTEPLLTMLGGHDGYRRHVRDVRTKHTAAPEGFDAGSLWRTSEDPDSTPRRVVPADGPLPASTATWRTTDDALADVARITGVDVAGLKTPRRGRGGQPARWVALWWLVRGAGERQADAARELGTTPQAASRMLAELRLRRSLDARLDGWLRELEDLRRS